MSGVFNYFMNKLIETVLTDRETVIGIIQKDYNISIIFGATKQDEKIILCVKCQNYVTASKHEINQCLDFFCEYCKRIIRIPLYCWEEDYYRFPNRHYTDAPRSIIAAQSLAQAHRKLIEKGDF